jgi:glycosyltransferase involved in cell wall biosynthesis
MKNILHLNYDSSSRNTSFPHLMYHKEFVKLGYQSKILSIAGDLKDSNIVFYRRTIFGKYDLSKIVRKALFDFNSKFYFYPDWNTNFISVHKSIELINFRPDVIFVYWTKFAFNFKFIQKLSDYFNAQVVFVLLDMAHLTGGCHYAYNCSSYTSGCGCCPVLPLSMPFDLSYRVIKKKTKYLSLMNASVLAPTSLLVKQAKHSLLFKNYSTFHIPFPVNEEIFSIRSIISARQELGLPLDSKIILFGASKLSEPRKGFIKLMESLKILKNLNSKYQNEKIFLLVIGKLDVNLQLPFPSMTLGYKSFEGDLATAFQACDLFVSPSLEDSGPLMVNFSLMCGRPVVAFDIGVAKDYVVNGSTGYCAKLPNEIDFAEGILEILSLSEKTWSEYSSRCRDLAISKFSREAIRLELLQLINSINFK